MKIIYIVYVIILAPVILTLGGMFFFSLVKGPVFIREAMTSPSRYFGSDRLGNPSPWDLSGHACFAIGPHLF